MADPKIYVNVNTFAIKDIFDAKHKSRVQALMTKTAEQAVKGSSKLTLDAGMCRGQVDGYTVDMEQAADRLVPHLLRFTVPRAPG